MTLDYWNIDFEDVIVIENAQTKVTIENVLCNARTPDCRDPDIIRNPLVGEDPNDNLQHSGEISKVIAQFINAPTIETSGVDLNATLGFDTNSLEKKFVGIDLSHGTGTDQVGALDTRAGYHYFFYRVVFRA